MTYTIDMSEEMAERITSAVLRQIRKETTSGGVMEACSIVLTHLEPVLMKEFDECLNDYTEEFRDSGFTDDFGVYME
tara:strand:- start:523 stop:753 length:231 start_codon:yes stop_codon:yes gene_type:complete